MNKDQVLNYLAGLTDREIAEHISAAGDLRTQEPAPTAERLLLALEEIRETLSQVDEQIQEAIERGDFQTSIALKQQSQPLREARLARQQQLSKMIDEGN